MGDIAQLMIPGDLTNSGSELPKYIVLTLAARDIDGCRVTERHSYKNDLLMTKMAICKNLSSLPFTDLNCERYGLPALSMFGPNDDDAVVE